MSKYNQENIDYSVRLFESCKNTEILFYLDDYKGRSFENAVVKKYFNTSPLNKIVKLAVILVLLLQKWIIRKLLQLE